MELTSREIQEALRHGNERVYETLFKKYYASLCAYAFRIINDMDDAEEIVQHLFLIIWEKRGEIEINVSFKSYLFRSVHNRSLNYLDKLKVKKGYIENLKSSEIQYIESAEETMQQFELQQKIKIAINKLPPQCKLIFELSRFEDLKYSEIANRLNLSIKTIENQMGKALRILRLELKDYLPLLTFLLSAYYC